MVSPLSPAPAYDTLMFPRYLLGAAAAGGADARQLARDARLPAWALNAGRAMLPSWYAMVLFELAERALGDPDIAMTVVTRNVDFGAPVTTFTFSARDLDLPMRNADPGLARILNRYAASLAAPPPVTWHSHFRQLLAQSIEAGSPSLESVAKQMAVSPRTLQRELAEHGTTWRAELNAARQRRAVKARQSGTVSTAALARQLAYSDPRSVRRALRRWDNEATEVLTTS